MGLEHLYHRKSAGWGVMRDMFNILGVLRVRDLLHAHRVQQGYFFDLRVVGVFTQTLAGPL